MLKARPYRFCGIPKLSSCAGPLRHLVLVSQKFAQNCFPSLSTGKKAKISSGAAPRTRTLTHTTSKRNFYLSTLRTTHVRQSIRGSALCSCHTKKWFFFFSGFLIAFRHDFFSFASRGFSEIFFFPRSRCAIAASNFEKRARKWSTTNGPTLVRAHVYRVYIYEKDFQRYTRWRWITARTEGWCCCS